MLQLISKNQQETLNNRSPVYRGFSEKLWMGIVFIALVIRILDSIRIPLFMDEIPILYNVARFIKNRTLLPSHFNYPTFFSYLIVSPMIVLFLVYYFMSGFPLSGLFNSQWIGFLYSSNLPLFVWAGRSVSILFSVLSIILVYFYLRKKIGLLGALISISVLCFDPLGGRFISYSRYSLPDIAAAFLVTASLIQGLIFLEKGHIKWLIGSAFIAGLAVSTKYNTGLVVIPLIYLCFLNRKAGYWKRLIWVPVTMLIGFLVGSPGWLLYPSRFIHGYLFEANHMEAGHLGQFGQDWIWVIEYLWSCKTVMLPMIVTAIGYAFVKHKKEDIFFLLLIIPAFIIIGRFEKKSIHYFLFLYPILSLYLGGLISIIERKFFQTRKRGIFIFSLIILFVIQPGYRLIPKLKRDLSIKSNVKAEKWIEENIPSGSVIVLDRLHLPNLLDSGEIREQIQTMKTSNNIMWKQVEQLFEGKSQYDLIPIQDYWLDLEAFLDANIPYVVLTSYNYSRFFSISIRLPDKATPLYEDFMKKKSFYSYFIFNDNKKYRQLIRITSDAALQIRIYQLIQ